MCRRRATGKSSHTRYSWATNHGAAAPIGSHSDSDRKSYSGLPACSPREDDRLVCPAWRVGSWVPQSPIARPSDPIRMSFETGLLLSFFVHSLANGRCANYLINLIFCQVMFPDSLSEQNSYRSRCRQGPRGVPPTNLAIIDSVG